VALPGEIELPTAERLDGLRFGIPTEYVAAGIEPGVLARFEQTVALVEELGATCVEISLPHTEYALPAYYIIAPAEASANLARFDGVRYGYRAGAADDLVSMYEATRGEGFGAEVKRRVMIGTYALSSGYYDAYYSRAQKLRTLISRDFTEAFKICDVLLTPATPGPAFGVGEKTADPVSMYLNDVFTVTVNLAGLPGISVPAGLTAGGLPLGLQFIGKAFDEATILRAAHAIECASGFSAKPAHWWKES
jgi:aspartyl-tRNA(Asn)/glutamyl-tRNA(Gln) amidotransferase subunit A